MAHDTLFISVFSSALFPAGQLVTTPGVHELVQQGTLNVNSYLHRHMHGDWGDLDECDRQQNHTALESGGRLLSAYQVTPDLRLWIITEWDRSVTTLLLPNEY